MSQSDERSAIAQLTATTFSLGNEAPKAERTAPLAGSMNEASRVDHRHPRTVSPHTGTLDGSGQGLLTFSRTFQNMPAMAFGWVELANNRPVMFKVVSWLKWNTAGTGLIAWTEGAAYAGCIIKGYRGQPLPQLQIVSGILTAVITGVNTLVTALTGYNVFAGSAAGVVFTATAIQVGDET